MKDDGEVPAGNRVAAGDAVEARDVILDDVAPTDESNIVNLYIAGHKQHQDEEGKIVEPFVQVVSLEGPGGEVVRLWGMFDDGAMVAALCSRVYAKVKHRLGATKPSQRRLRMADGKIVKAEAVWEGIISLGGVRLRGSFEIFDSGGSWSFLLGKPLILAFDAVHYYRRNEVTIKVGNQEATLANRFKDTKFGEDIIHYLGFGEPRRIEAGTTVENKQAEAEEKGTSEDVRAEAEEGGASEDGQAEMEEGEASIGTAEVKEATAPNITQRAEEQSGQTHEPPSDTNDKERGGGIHTTPPDQQKYEPETTTSTPICIVSADTEDYDIGAPIMVDDDTAGQGIYTRKTNPFQAARVEEVLRQVSVGDDLSDEQRQEVRAFIRRNADVFALSVGEVLAAEGAVHTLNIPNDATFSKRVHQRPLTPPQRQYLHEKINEMLEAGVIEQCEPGQVKCVSPTTLAQKAHQGIGLTLEELQHRVNDQCVANGLEPHFPMPDRPRAPSTDGEEQREQKWRICQNFAEINKITKIAPMPQGDIRAKQQKLSGKRWVSLFDFASGFYAVEVAEASRPYTAFYVEGRGYFWYRKMPFGLTGAPSTFAQVTARSLHDLLVEEVLELFVDDGGTVANEFEDMMAKLEKIFTRCREKKLSISAAKTKLFATTGVFAGASVGPNGVQPDMAKLTAIVNWRTPEDAQNLAAFLGLTSWFRDLVHGYAKVEAPLRNLLREVEVPGGASRTVYRKAMANFKLKDRWTREHAESFLALKTILTSEPVLRAPQWDGTPFVLTTDGCKDAFGAVLAQRFTTTTPSGASVTKLHPIGFASKRTSTAEEKYKPFLLEFAALKFGLDKFSDTVWGFPVIIETDCQALWDVLMNDKLSATHARWRDGILAHQIIDVRHLPGKINVVADGLSRAAEGAPKADGDGSEWTVCEDWEAVTGLTHDIFYMATVNDGEELRQRFAEEPVFLEVVEALLDLDQAKSASDKRRARHRASEYFIEDGKLWRLGGGRRARARAKVECVTKKEAVELARVEHQEGGHWQRDAIKKRLTDVIWSPGLDASIIQGIKDCAQCKNFGGTHLHALLNPITRRHPFELLVGDYLSLPVGIGGYHTVGMYLDTYSQHIWGYKYKTAGSGKTTVGALSNIFHAFAPSETFMSDGGKHFDNEEVRDFCGKWGTTTHVVAAYSPWVNGLVEGANKLLLHILKRLCSPGLGEDEYENMTTADLPRSWPNHFDEAIKMLNWRLLPALDFKPKELLLGLVINTPKTATSDSTTELTGDAVATQMAYAAQQRLDGYAAAVQHAVKRKEAFDKRVLAESKQEVVFRRGDLVQIYRNDLDYTFKTDRKLLPKWSVPHRVVARNVNSYTIETLEGKEVAGVFSARRLRRFWPRQGTRLATEQEVVEKRIAHEDAMTEAQEAGAPTTSETSEPDTAGQREQEDEGG